MPYKKNEIVLVQKTLQFVKILDYCKENEAYKVRYFKKRINEVAKLTNDETRTYTFEKQVSNEIWLHPNSLHKININYDYWLMYSIRYYIRKTFTRKPLPHLDKYILLQYKQSIIAQRIRLKKRNIFKEIEEKFDLYKLIGEWRKKYKKKIGLVSFVHSVSDVETYSKNDIDNFYKKIIWYEKH
jgi:hypothetical protein